MYENQYKYTNVCIYICKYCIYLYFVYIYIYGHNFAVPKKGYPNDWITPGHWSMPNPWEVTRVFFSFPPGLMGGPWKKLVPNGLERPGSYL